MSWKRVKLPLCRLKSLLSHKTTSPQQLLGVAPGRRVLVGFCGEKKQRWLFTQIHKNQRGKKEKIPVQHTRSAPSEAAVQILLITSDLRSHHSCLLSALLIYLQIRIKNPHLKTKILHIKSTFSVTFSLKSRCVTLTVNNKKQR